jgi:hypothetical protein
MHGKLIRWSRALLLLSAFTLSGCFLVAAGAGAGAAVAYTNRGATSTVDGAIEQVFDRSAAAYQQLGIGETGRSSEDSGTKRKLVGTKDGMEVTVELARTTDSTTKVEVYAKKSTVEYDKKFARDVLNRIIARG